MTELPGSGLRVEPSIQHYDWGHPSFLPALFGRAADGRPWAEAWYGAHPRAPASARLDAGCVGLDRLLQEQGDRWFGERVQRDFGALPYLLKLLAAARPLSIQVHPDAIQARQGYEREEAAGIPLDAPERNYRDPQSKPELIVALTPLYAFCGFRPLPAIEAALTQLPELAGLLPSSLDHASDLEALLQHWFALPDRQLQSRLTQLLQRLEERSRASAKASANTSAAASAACFDARAAWALRALHARGTTPAVDRSLLFVFLLELHRLAPGQALFVAPGTPHAYLQGAGIEVMAASDNVLRAGLTGKHVDTAELLRVLRTDLPTPVVFEADAAGGYPTPVREFELQRLDAGPDTLQADGPELLLALDAEPVALFDPRGDDIVLPRGGSLLFSHGARYGLRGGSCWRCRVPNLHEDQWAATTCRAVSSAERSLSPVSSSRSA